MDHIEQVLQNGLRDLRLPDDELMKKRKGDWERVEAFQVSLESGKAAVAKQKLNDKVSGLIEGLTSYLTSEESYKHALKMKKSQLTEAEQENYDKRNVDDLVCQRFCVAICHFPEFEVVRKWASNELVPDVLEAMKELNMLKANVAAGKTRTASIYQHSTSHANESQEMTAVEMTAAVALAVPVLLVGVPLALAVGVVAAPIYAVVKMFSSIRRKSFKIAVQKAYKELVENALADDAKMLRDIVLSLLNTTCPPVHTLLTDIPMKMSQLKDELMARNIQDKKDIPYYQSVLQKCQAIKGTMAKFQLELNVHTYMANDLVWPEPKVPVASGSFGTVYKVTLPNKQEGALKQMKDPLTEDNSEEFMKELCSCRYEHCML